MNQKPTTDEQYIDNLITRISSNKRDICSINEELKEKIDDVINGTDGIVIRSDHIESLNKSIPYITEQSDMLTGRLEFIVDTVKAKT